MCRAATVLSYQVLIGGVTLNYQKLKGRIKEMYDTQEAFAEAMEMSYTALNQRLNEAVEWKTSDIVKACDKLEIPLSDAHLYFFTPKVENI